MLARLHRQFHCECNRQFLSCTAHKKSDKTEPGLFKEEFRCTGMLCLCSRTYCCYDQKSNKYKFRRKGLSRRTLEDCGDCPLSKYRKVLEDCQCYFNQQVFEQFNTVSQRMNGQRKGCLTSTPREL